MFFHFTPPHATFVRPLIEAGFTYIGFFLLISGFVLSYNYAHRAESVRPGRFYAARASRLYPVYLLSLIVSLSMLHAEWVVRQRPEFWAGAILTPLLLQGWSPVLATFWNTVAWTLSTEAMLYLAFPFVNRAKWWPKSVSGLLRLFLLFWACELVLPTVYLLLNPDGLHNIDRYSSAFWLRALKYTPLPYAPVFLAGVTLGRLHGALKMSDRAKMWASTGAAAAILAVLYLLMLHIPYILLHGGLLTPLFAMLVIGLTGRHWLASVLGFGPMALFGRASFCLYLLHFNTWMLLHEWKIPQRLGLEAWDPWVSYAIILLVAFGAYRLVERPIQGYLLTTYVYKAPVPVRMVQ